jgi:hypothetical protein
MAGALTVEQLREKLAGYAVEGELDDLPVYVRVHDVGAGGFIYAPVTDLTVTDVPPYGDSADVDVVDALDADTADEIPAVVINPYD